MTNPTNPELVEAVARVAEAMWQADSLRQAERIAGRLCDWDADGEPPVPLMQEAARMLRHQAAALSRPTPDAVELVEAVERVAEAMWQADSLRALGRVRFTLWSEEGDETKAKWRSLALAAITAIRSADPEYQRMRDALNSIAVAVPIRPHDSLTTWFNFANACQSVATAALKEQSA